MTYKKPIIFIVILLFIFLPNRGLTSNVVKINTESLVFASHITGTGEYKNVEIIKYYRGSKQIAQETYSNDVMINKWGEIPDGLVLTLHPSGHLGSIITYKNQIPNGIALSFFENGNLHSMVHYKNGKPEGVSTIYYPNGHIHVEQKHLNGKEIYFRQYDVNGKIEFER